MGSSQQPACLLHQLPVELLLMILDYCPSYSIANFCLTNRTLCRLGTPALYKRLDLSIHRTILLHVHRNTEETEEKISNDKYAKECFAALINAQQRILKTMLFHPEYTNYVKHITWTLLEPTDKFTIAFYNDGTLREVFDKFFRRQSSIHLDTLRLGDVTTLFQGAVMICSERAPHDEARDPISTSYLSFIYIQNFSPISRGLDVLFDSSELSSTKRWGDYYPLFASMYNTLTSSAPIPLPLPLHGPFPKSFEFQSLQTLMLRTVGQDLFPLPVVTAQDNIRWLECLAAAEEKRYAEWEAFINCVKPSLRKLHFYQIRYCSTYKGYYRKSLLRLRLRPSSSASGSDHDNALPPTPPPPPMIPIKEQCVSYILPVILSGNWPNLHSLELLGVRERTVDLPDGSRVTYAGFDNAIKEDIMSAVGGGCHFHIG
ncbi:hypothetical protein ACJ72_05819 [Emergomyces africanus]|uniref:F-box domain-containing protein n=1 Tax=Emergomyces africanus TaxID=1955775 RepID=A0A1B7NT94_9EURO|nr:hypothetical protein ACJ72_05819 [Emergomyces africanus]